jgi:hypothetical protein
MLEGRDERPVSPYYVPGSTEGFIFPSTVTVLLTITQRGRLKLKEF